MHINLFEGVGDSKLRPLELTFERLAETLSKPVRSKCAPCGGKDCPAKQGRLWSPTRYKQGATVRADGHVAAVTAAVFDLDGPRSHELTALAERLQGLSFIVHGTHTAGRYRVIIELHREVPASEWRAVWHSMAEQFFPALPSFDVSCKNESRFYFFPVVEESREYEYSRGVGVPYAWSETQAQSFTDEIFSDIPSRLAESVRVESEALLTPTVLDLVAIRGSMGRAKDAQQADLLNRVFSQQALAHSGGRSIAINTVMSVLASKPAQAYSEETMMAVVGPSICAMACEPEGAQYWLGVASASYRRALARRQERVTRREQLNEALSEAAGLSGDLDEDDASWRQQLQFSVDEEGAIRGVKPVPVNAGIILTNHPELRGTLRFNELTKDVDITGGPLAKAPRASLDTYLMNWLATSEFKLSLSQLQVRQQLLLTARNNAYDPLKDYLHSVHADGGERIDRFLVDYCGAADTEHNRRISRRWFISAVARGLQPGCKVDTVLVLQGREGAKKSTVFAELGGEFFTDAHIDISSKDSLLLAGQVWIAEFAELNTPRKADKDRMKQFLTQAVDPLRVPYGTVTEKFPRHCVFVGTCNPKQVLEENEGGNRRYWPVSTGHIDIRAIRRDRDLLWAEAVGAFYAGKTCTACANGTETRCEEHRWWLDPAEELEASANIDEFTEENPLVGELHTWFLRLRQGERDKVWSAAEIAKGALGYTSDRLDTQVSIRIGKALRALGFERKKMRRGPNTYWMWLPPKALIEASSAAAVLPAHLDAVSDPDDSEVA